MRIYITILLAFALLQNAIAQTNVFHENMESIDSVLSSGTPGWFANGRLSTSGAQSDSSSITTGGVSILETQSFDLTGYTYVIFTFNHICKLSFFDRGIVEVFNGSAWIQLTAQQMVAGQIDSSAFDGQGNFFTEGIYPDWLPGQTVSPTNNWWKTEAFDLSSLLANVPNAKIRWTASDLNTPGGDGRAGWFIDDINVIAAPCELQPPSLTQLVPIIQNNVLSTGPYTLNINLTDASGIDTNNVLLIYTVNNGIADTVNLVNSFGNVFSGTIPAVNDSDSVCYYFFTTDFSPCLNPVRYPAAGCIQFVAQSGYVIPFCDDFDLNNFWTDSTLSGSAWGYGLPTTSPPFPHSAPNVWEVSLNSQYVANTEAYLFSPPISFLNTTNASVDFWYYNDSENSWDGARLDYSIDNGTTWSILGNLATGVNWYNDAAINSSTLPAWTGASNGWVNAMHSLSVVDNQPTVIFRFTFTSDASVQDNGFAIDDFCITTPVLDDAGIISVASANTNLPAVGAIDSVNVSIKNFGGNNISNVPVYFSINNGTPIGPYVYGDTLLSLQTSAVFTLSGFTYTVPSGAYTICAWTDYANDNILIDDTSCTQWSSIVQYTITDSISFCDNFESGLGGWHTDVQPGGNILTKWELGTPNFGVTNSAHSMPNAWDINLDSAYTNNANTALISPYFNVSANANPKVSFWINYNAENIWDGVRLEFSNDGIIWNTIGTVADTASVNWYNNQSLTCSNLPGWSNTSGGWQYAEYRNLSFLNAQTIQLRFVFCSDGVVTRDGFSIDDFCFGSDTSFTTQINTQQNGSSQLLLSDNYPNPFSNNTTIDFYLPQNGTTQLTITDVTGREIEKPINNSLAKGLHTVKINNSNLSAGIYFYHLHFNEKVISKKMVLVN